ncbi:MAG: hypothetical protein U0414_03220 [Polyangiaceae bacterium]
MREPSTVGVLTASLLCLLVTSGCDDTAGTGGAGSGSTTSSAATMSWTSTSTSTGGLHPGPGEPCDVVAQDCADPAAPKCIVQGIPQNTPEAVCAEAFGAVAEGELCERPTNEPSIDTCAPRGFCSRGGFPTETPQRRACRDLCKTGADCPASAMCYWLTPAAAANQPAYGICIERCDPLATACEDAEPGTGCTTAVDTEGGFTTVCDLVGTGVDGATCASPIDCAPGFTCDGTLTCRAYCGDATHTCPMGYTCTPSPYFDPTVSWCVPN